MKSTVLESVKSSVRYWWILTILGAVFIFSGIWVLSSPVESYVALSLIFGVLMFVSGLMELVVVIANWSQIQNRGWQLTAALFDFLIGLILVSYPVITMQVLPFLVAFFFMFKGFGEISLSVDLKDQGERRWGIMLFFGLVAVLLGVLIIFNPALGGLTIVLTTGFAFIAVGIFKLLVSFQLRKVKSIARDVQEDVGERVVGLKD